MSCSWLLLRGSSSLLVGSQRRVEMLIGTSPWGCRAFFFSSNCISFHTGHNPIRSRLFVSLFSLLTLHNRSYLFLTSSTFRLCLGCLVLGFVYTSFWNLKMSSSLFATESRFTIKFLLLFCRCRSLGARSPFHTFWI